ncbi:MAG: SAVED domain-containing protein [Saprospiraceae bacterium]
MSKTKIPNKVSTRLWGKSSGRCEYEGCNCILWRDEVTKFEFNSSYIAHIVADEPSGPRGDVVLSPRLAKDLNNLMLLCDKHHRLIDVEDVVGHPVERLLEMKRKHEERMEVLSGIKSDKASHIVLFGANIGHHSPVLNYQLAANAMYPEWYPASAQSTELSLINSLEKDSSPQYWMLQERNLKDQLNGSLIPLIRTSGISHLSVFALAPQPLLILLGIQLNDILPLAVYQKHREPDTWVWQEAEDFEHQFQILQRKPSVVALNFSMSATITNDRIERVLGKDCSIYTLTHERPGNDYLKSKQILSDFRVQIRQLFDKIKTVHGHGTVLHVFPAMPVSAAIEFGRIWMPKADMPLVIYDENRALGGFVKAFEINHSL